MTQEQAYQLAAAIQRAPRLATTQLADIIIGVFGEDETPDAAGLLHEPVHVEGPGRAATSAKVSAEPKAAPVMCKAWCGRRKGEITDRGFWQRFLDGAWRGFCTGLCHDEGRPLSPAAAPATFTAREATALGEAMDESMSAASVTKPEVPR